MAGPGSSFEEEDWFQYIDLDQAKEVEQVGAWEIEDGGIQNVEDTLPLVGLPSRLLGTCLLTCLTREDTRSHEPDAPGCTEDVGQGPGGGDLDTSAILERLSQQHQEAIEGYFIGLEGQRNAPSGQSGTGVEDVEGLYQLESPDAETGELEQQQQTPVAESLPVSETEWAKTTSTTEDWSLVGERTGAAGSSSQPHAAHDDPSQDTRRGHHGQLVCNHPGCGATYDCMSKLRHDQRKHVTVEDRPYPCPRCSKPKPRFLHPKDLDRHLQTLQHAERQFECPDCLRKFTRRDLRKRHWRKFPQRVRPP